MTSSRTALRDRLAVASKPGGDPAVGDLAGLLTDWTRHLRARNLSPRTITSYVGTGEEFTAYLVEKGMPTDASAVSREHIETWLADLHDRLSPATVARHYRNLQQLWRWLLDDGEISRSPMERMRPPAVPEQPVPLISEQDLSGLLAACKGNTFENRRDTAILRLLIDTGMRLSELTGLGVADLDFDSDVAHVMGKGRRPRACPFGNKTGDALRRYLRARARHPMAARWPDRLWLGKKGPVTDSGIAQLLDRRAADAGIGHIHPHLFRHGFAHAWLAAGGQENDRCGSPAGGPARWSAGTPHPPQTRALGTRTAGCRWATGCEAGTGGQPDGGLWQGRTPTGVDREGCKFGDGAWDWASGAESTVCRTT